MKKYCIFSAQFLPHMGGVENYTYNVAKALIKKGHEVTVVTSNTGQLKSYEQMEGIEIYRIPCFNLMNGRYPVIKVNRLFRKIHRTLLNKRFDLLMINTRFYTHSVYGGFLAKKLRTRCIIIEHGTAHLSVHNQVLDFFENIVEHIFTLIDKHYCKEYYGVSEACLEWIRHFHIEGKGILYNSVDLDKINSILDHPVCDYRKKYNIDADDIIITFTGRLLKEKGVLPLVKAFEKINRKQNRYLFIAGEGDEYKMLLRLNCKNVIILGRLCFEEVISLLKSSDIFCLPSDSEGMPSSVLEAVACNTYVVTTRKGGAKELLNNGEYGMVMDDNKEETIKCALEKAIQDPEKRYMSEKNALNRLKDKFTWEKVAEKIEVM